MAPFIYFRANDQKIGNELYKTLPAKNTVQLVKDINPGTGSSSPSNFCKVGMKVYFSANNGTNGTGAGTVLVKDIFPGTNSSSPSYLTEMGGKIYFRANGGNGYELWVTDGTAAGTKLASDTNPGGLHGYAYDICLSGGNVYFEADNGTTGRELFMLKDAAVSAGIPGATAQPVGRSHGPGEFRADDPVLNTTMSLTVTGKPANVAGLICFGFQDRKPFSLVPGMEFYFSILTRGVLMNVALPPTGKATLPVPNVSALLGARLVGQIFVGPTSTPPLGIDFTNAVLFTFGR